MEGFKTILINRLRGFCPSCGARRMVESAAHLVDHVFPEAPVLQWVLTFPFSLRFLLAAQPGVLTEVLAIVQRGISTFLVRHSGFTVASGARTGAVTLIQRFGSALNLNMHLHQLFLDGAYRFAGGKASFYRARRSTRDELAKLLDALSRRIVRLLERRGLLIAEPEYPGRAHRCPSAAGSGGQRQAQYTGGPGTAKVKYARGQRSLILC